MVAVAQFELYGGEIASKPSPMELSVCSRLTKLPAHEQTCGLLHLQ
jgi:hypothetical protein